VSGFSIAIAGLGSRGREVYARFAHDQNIPITAVADTDPARVAEAAETFGIARDHCFVSADELLKQGKLADALVVCTQDENHFDTSVRALKKGYHLLLEKPIATKEEHCAEIARVAAEENRNVVVCHVLRYSPLYRRIKEIIDSGGIGEIVTVSAFEGVGFFHQAHSFVRGAWGNTKESSPMILAKCCHDADILVWLIGRRIKSVSSFGGLYYFKAEKAPRGAALRCLGDCKAKDGCPYDAEKIYFTNESTGIRKGNIGWPANVLTRDVTENGIREALISGPYGRCVFHCDNDAVDHQVVNMEFEGGITAQLTMTAFSPVVKRTMRVMGTLGQIEADTQTNIIMTSVFGKEETAEKISIERENENHGGGDIRLFNAFTALMTKGESDTSLTSVERSVESHLICFAAERSRLNGGAPELLGG